MRVLWVKAPLLLRRHPPVLAAVILAIALAALAASAVPLVRAGVENESLSAQLRSMTPLAAGLEIHVQEGRVGRDGARRAAAVRLGRSVRFLGAPVLSSLTTGSIQVAGSAAPGFIVVPLARTGAIAHVQHVTSSAGPGVWIADAMAKVTHLRPGGTLRLTVQGFISRQRVVALPIAGIYHALEADRDNPYWANWQQDIRAADPDSPAPPPFVLMDEASLQRVASALSPIVENRFEFPVDPHGLSFADAQRLNNRFGALRAQLLAPRSAAGISLGCRPRVCETGSSLSAALTVASTDVASVTPTISLLSAIGLVIAFGLCVAAGLFLVRRRTDEAHVLFTRGEAATVFASRTGLEALLPALAGLGAGLGLALLALRALAPGGSRDRRDGRRRGGARRGRQRRSGSSASRSVPASPSLGAPARTNGDPSSPASRGRSLRSSSPACCSGSSSADTASRTMRAARAIRGSRCSSSPSSPWSVPRGSRFGSLRRLPARRSGGAPPEIFLAFRRIAATRGLFARRRRRGGDIVRDVRVRRDTVEHARPQRRGEGIRRQRERRPGARRSARAGAQAVRVSGRDRRDRRLVCRVPVGTSGSTDRGRSGRARAHASLGRRLGQRPAHAAAEASRATGVPASRRSPHRARPRRT